MIQASGGLQFESQDGGTPNTFSADLFAPLSQGTRLAPLNPVLVLSGRRQ